MDNTKLYDDLITWCRIKIDVEKMNPLGLSGKRLEGYERAMHAVMSHLHDLKEKHGSN